MKTLDGKNFFLNLHCTFQNSSPFPRCASMSAVALRCSLSMVAACCLPLHLPRSSVSLEQTKSIDSRSEHRAPAEGEGASGLVTLWIMPA